jgi:apolipoprotein N-acyltransferase
MTAARGGAFALAAAAGACTVFAFAPFGVSGIAFVTLALLLVLWQHAPSPRAAAATGFAFGLGLFGTGASWLTIALVTFGGMPAWLAGAVIALLTLYLALWPALAGYVAARVTLGYSQVPDGLLRGYAPVGGVYLVTLALVLGAALLARAIDGLASRSPPMLGTAAALALALVAGSASLSRVEWTAPSGPPLAISLVQGNVVQELKFDPKFRQATFDRYLSLVGESRGRLIVLPESAFPMFSDEIPDDVLLSLIRTASARDGDVLLGLFTAEAPAPGSDEPRYYNTVVALGASDLQFYRKNHLVPFGETIPLKPLIGWFVRSVLHIPLADQSRGGATQPPLLVAGQKVALDICYEDAFGAELIHGARQAHLLVNVTNDAWYGRSIAAFQHNQIAAMRALELGRPMLRATNTGITSAIAHDGRELARLPWFTTGILEVAIAGRTGATPYLRFGDVPTLVLALLLVVIPIAFPLKSRPR